MIDKIKDFIYNISDLIVALLIVAVAAYIISWKVEDIMGYPEQVIAQTKTEDPMDNAWTNPDTETSSDLESPDVDNSDADDTDNDPDTNEESNSGSDIDNSGSDIDNSDSDIDNSNEADETDIESDPVDDQPSQPANKIQIDIPSGSPGVKIASLLQEEGLIDSTSEFINRLEERKLDSKLRAGNFKIPENASLDEVINILTGQ